MANRSIVNPALLDAISRQVVTYYETVEITITYAGVDTTYYLTNGPRSFSYGGNTYNAFGQLMDFGNIEENAQFNIGTVEINISGIDPYESGAGGNFLQQLLLDSTQYLDRPVVIRRAYFENDVYIDNLEIFRGRISTAQAKRDSESIAASIQVSSHWTDFERVTGRHTNSTSQQYWYAGDLGMDYAKEIQKEIEWRVPE